MRVDGRIGGLVEPHGARTAQTLDPLPDSIHQPGRERGHPHGFETRPLARDGRRGAIEQVVGACRTFQRERVAGGQLLHGRRRGGGVGHGIPPAREIGSGMRSISGVVHYTFSWQICQQILRNLRKSALP